ncbi:hypothetical protein GPL15_18010 [Clostridium sp. MCC353]|uniref:hypothetical protein n=1 Tax=Clostridium sp. MCC353 TaxID=2592646 RepID=UPI001C02839F|nr:hypothetical protein [Clostridium sp. MCC353]MBT9778396.1 hypothetical protein [Clostridium sp. MCC353]
MEKREKAAVGGIAAIAVISLAAGIYYMFLKGGMTERLLAEETLFLMGEILLVFLWNLFWIKKGGNKLWGFVAAAAGGVIFAWCHRIFLPLVVSGLYAGYLILLGKAVFRLLTGERKCPVSWYEGFLWGSGTWILTVCLVSAFGRGGLTLWRGIAAVTAAGLYLAEVIKAIKRKNGQGGDEEMCRAEVFRGACSNGWFMAFSLALIFAMLALQAGRMNIAVDYDSIHYGLRSPYVLDNGKGIYENLGNINLVYTYSKGLEALVLPLAGTATYGYVLSFNLWVSAGILALIYRIGREFTDRHGALAAAAAAACIPGIMNMGITAKTDSITLFFQLVFFLTMLRYLDSVADGGFSRSPDRDFDGGFNGESGRGFYKGSARESGRSLTRESDSTKFFVTGSCACLITYILKPTSLVFTTAIYGLTFIYLLAGRKFRVKLKHRIWLCAAVCAAAWAGIWTRTFLITGYPVTSVFTSVWDLLGFQIKYPFSFQGIPDAGGELTLAENLMHLWDRLWKMAAAPVGEDMAHVIIAWGSSMIPVLAAAVVLFRGKRDIRHNYLLFLYLPLAFISLVSVQMLWQVDGNYFMLFYSMTVILAAASIYGGISRQAQRAVKWILAPVMFFAVVMTCITNWSGTLGLTPVKVRHSGYYSHLEENRNRMAEKGNEAIWNLLASDPRNRVIAMGEHLDVVTFPCNVQSYYDVTGSGGNVYLVKKLDYFKEFLRYAKIDYLYVQADDETDGPRAAEIVRYMLEDGSLYDVKYEYGNMIARVDHNK